MPLPAFFFVCDYHAGFRLGLGIGPSWAVESVYSVSTAEAESRRDRHQMEGGAVLAKAEESRRDCSGREQVQLVRRACSLLEALELRDQQVQVEAVLGAS